MKSGGALFQKIDAVALRVRDYRRAMDWYEKTLGFSALHVDRAAEQGVLEVNGGTTICVRQLGPGENPAPMEAAGSFPILLVEDARAVREELIRRWVRCGEIVEDGVRRHFTFRDPDGNRLEAVQLLK